MTEKPSPMTFQPAPRPTSRVSTGVAENLAAANADLGFTRASTPAVTARGPEPRPSIAGPTPRAAAPARVARPTKPPRPAPALGLGHPSLKFDVPDSLWTALKMEAIQRRVTVKYLVLEALSKQGYEVDLTAIPEDGRRLR